jgi:hypothetical protein
MKTNLSHTLKLMFLGALSLTVTGCIEWLGAAGTGAYVAAEYAMTGTVRKTMCYDFQCTKKALLVALCRMGITAELAREIENGEEITASARDLDIRIELRAVTAKATRVSVNAEKHFLDRDKATAEEIIFQTQMIAEKILASGHSPSKQASAL